MTGALSAGGGTLVTALAAAGMVLALTAPDPGSTRLTELAVRPAASGPPAAVGGVGGDGDQAVRGRGLASVGAAAGTLMLVDGLSGLVAAALVGVITARVLRRLEPRAVIAERERFARDLPVVAHLVAGALDAGASPVGALELVGSALGGPVAPHLRRIAAVSRLGGDLAASWRSVPSTHGLAPLARTISRALETGAPLSDALDRLAADLRSQLRFDVDRRARSVGVRAAAPLGLCFLPAFLLVGVVPVVIGIATTIFATIG